MVKTYLEQRNLAQKEDPLKWWAEKQITFPFLVPHAKKFLTIPAPSVPSEGYFLRIVKLQQGNVIVSNPRMWTCFCFFIKSLNRMFCLNMIGQKVIIFVIDTGDTCINSNQYCIVFEIHGIAHH